MPIESTAALLGDRLEALAAALLDAGVSPERAAPLLGAASAATAHAVTLVALHGPVATVARVVAPAAAVEEPAERRLPLAA